MSQMLVRVVAGGLVVLSLGGCNVLGPSCLARQERGHVTTISGEVPAGQVVTHRVQYDTQGSQNTVQVAWARQSVPGGPGIRVYATRTQCVDFRPPPAINDGVCAPLGIAGAIDGVIASSLNITNGRGNPVVLGSPPEYLLWVIGDGEQAVNYTLDVTWFFGPDC